jgi:hypothetical protein
MNKKRQQISRHFKYVDSLEHRREEALIVLQQVVGVLLTSGQKLLVLACWFMQQPISINKDLSQTLADMATAVID